MPDTFKNRLIIAMEKRGIKAAELSRLTGLSKPRISQYVNGTYEAKQQALYKLAKALNVSEAWLMGYDTDMEKNQVEMPTAEDFSKWDEEFDAADLSGQSHFFKTMQKIMPDVFELLMEYNSLNEEGKKEAILRVRELSFIPQYKKESE